jgi:phosphatidylserine/phosphatidylglycerophosphate/cardiolipin synthase-like enzyme
MRLLRTANGVSASNWGIPGARRATRRALRAALAVGLLVVPTTAAAFFSLPTGPSEKGDEIGAPAAPQKTLPGTLPAGVKLLADREYQAALVEQIAAARSEIIVCAGLFGARETVPDRARAVADRLAEAAGRGVKVEVILEIGLESAPATRANRAAARLLASRGVAVFADGSGSSVHASFVVVDRRLVFIGSHELSENSLGRYREASLLVDSPPLAAALLEQAASLKPVPYVEAPPRRPARRPPRSRSRKN